MQPAISGDVVAADRRCSCGKTFAHCETKEAAVCAGAISATADRRHRHHRCSTGTSAAGAGAVLNLTIHLPPGAGRSRSICIKPVIHYDVAMVRRPGAGDSVATSEPEQSARSPAIKVCLDGRTPGCRCCAVQRLCVRWCGQNRLPPSRTVNASVGFGRLPLHCTRRGSVTYQAIITLRGALFNRPGPALFARFRPFTDIPKVHRFALYFTLPLLVGITVSRCTR